MGERPNDTPTRVTLGKQGDLAARRRALAFVFEPAAVDKLFGVLAPRFQDRPGGYTRLQRTRSRRGDNAEMAFLSYLPEGEPTAQQRRAALRTLKREAEEGEERT